MHRGRLHFIPLLALLASVSACSARSPLETSEVTEAPDDAPDVEVELAPPRFDCRWRETPRPMLAAHVNGTIHWVFPDRTSREVARFDVPDGFTLGRTDILARRDGIAAIAVVTPSDGDERRAFLDAMVLDVNGEIRVRRSIPFPHNGVGEELGIVGRQDGLFVLHAHDAKIARLLVVEGREARLFDTPVAPRRDPDARGRVMVVDVRGNGADDLHFLDTRSGAVWPSRYVERPLVKRASGPHLLDVGMLYLARDPSRWIYETASGAVERPVEVMFSSELALAAWQSSGDRALFLLGATTPADAHYLTVDLASEVVRDFRLQPPDGYALPEAYWNPPAIDARGRVITTMSSENGVQVLASEDGHTWQALGAPLGLDVRFDLLVAGETVVVIAKGGGPTTMPGTLPSWSTQLIGQDGVGAELIRWQPGDHDNPIDGDEELSADGACLAYFRDGSLHVTESSGYRTDDLGLRAALNEPAAMSWIPVASP